MYENTFLREINCSDVAGQKQVERLLAAEGIRKDCHLDYTCGIFDEDGSLLATGSSYGNTMRCLAVSSRRRGTGLMNQIVTHLTSKLFERGDSHIFLYTKCETADFFKSLGFYEIVQIPGELSFMENKRNGFERWIGKMSVKTSVSGRDDIRSGAVVLNANPFTLGHQFLVEKAAKENDILHLFIVSEDCSLIPFSIRKRLVMEGTACLKNIRYHDSGSYMISRATFPGYFQKDENAVLEGQARLDVEIFSRIAKALGIRNRYVGEEPRSVVTGIYNQIMTEQLPKHGIECVVVPRRKTGGEIISASEARKMIKDGSWDGLKTLVPEPTWEFFMSPEASPVIDKIRQADQVYHY